MQKWEYLFVYASIHDGGCYTIPYRSKKKINPDFPGYINQLGGEGWELVGISEESGMITFALKRPKS
ncbi:DUF4177 domain-containing protein [Candidatus Poribacteria bacterium]|nr:DUF4177 domain-containing protein [Candidatus Poribacteria bacterium]